jgi:hypothetical protein
MDVFPSSAHRSSRLARVAGSRTRMVPFRPVLLLATLCLVGAVPMPASAQPSLGLPALPIPAFGGTVDQVRRDGTRLIVAGDFLGASPPLDVRGGLSIHHAISGARSHDTTFIHGDVYASVPDGAGGYYIGGRLYAVQSTLRLGLAHLLRMEPSTWALPPRSCAPTVSQSCVRWRSRVTCCTSAASSTR